MTANAPRNESNQPFGIALEELGFEYINGIKNYYNGRTRRFNVSADRMSTNFENDLNRNPKKFNEDERNLISILKNGFPLKSNKHIEWIENVFKYQSTLPRNEVSPLCKELVDEIDYVLAHEQGGFLNSSDYKGFRQRVIGELSKIYDEEIKFLGVIIRTLCLSGAIAINNQIYSESSSDIIEQS